MRATYQATLTEHESFMHTAILHRRNILQVLTVHGQDATDNLLAVSQSINQLNSVTECVGFNVPLNI